MRGDHDTSGRNALSPQFNPGKVATYAIAIDNDPQGGWGDYAAEAGGSIIPHPYAPYTTLTTSQMNTGITFLTKYLTGDHVMVPGDLSGPSANGANLEQMFAQGQVAMWEHGDWNTLTVKTSTTFPVGVATLPIGPTGRVSVFNGLIDGLNSTPNTPSRRGSSSNGSARRNPGPSWARAATSGRPSRAWTRCS
jgi:multiple sugar transport system substrate-binding protein